MNILVFNCGSSSLTYKVFSTSNRDSLSVCVAGKAHRVGVTGSEPSFIEHDSTGMKHREIFPIPDHKQAAELVLKYLADNNISIDAIGHRFVHGGRFFPKTTLIDKENYQNLVRCLPWAPIHNPNSLSVITVCRKKKPEVPQYVTFDTAFHATMPPRAYTYLLPCDIIEKFGFRKYGFHGLSYQYVSGAAAQYLKKPLESLKIVACHLGTGGSSVAAIDRGFSIDTSMGFSPLPDLIMSTRSGDIDPILTIYLMAVLGYSSDEIEAILNKQSGLLDITGFLSDIRDIINKFSEREEEQAELAFKMYIHRLRKYIGSYIIALRGIDALVFTDDIGVHNWLVREKVCGEMEWCGCVLDKGANRKAVDDAIHSLEGGQSRVAILSIPTEEEWVIAREGIKIAGAGA